MAKLTGTNPDQVPTNADLGTMAYQDKDNVKIGSIETGGKLNIQNTANMGGFGTKANAHLTIGNLSNNDALYFDANEIASDTSLNVFSDDMTRFSTGGSERVRISASGNVGIGTANPTHKLETVQTGQSTTAVFKNTNASWANDVSFSYAPSGSTVSDFSISSRSNGSTWLGSGYGPIHFQLDENENNSRSTKVTVRSDGYLTLNGNDIGGTQVTIADDAVASITPPRKGGFMFVTASGNGDYPARGFSNYFYYDVGASLDVEELFARGAVDVSTSDVSGTTGTDGNITVAVQSGVIKIENRSGGSITFQITFL